MILKNITFILTAIVFILFVWFFQVYFSSNSTQKKAEENFQALLKSKFDNKYHSQKYQINNYEITIFESSLKMDCTPDSIFLKNASPLIVFRSKNTGKITNIFELNFKSQDNLESGNNISLINFYYPSKRHGSEVFGLEASITWCGSDKTKALALFVFTDDQIKPIGYPVGSDTGLDFIIFDKSKNISYQLKTVPHSLYTKINDLNKDMEIDLLYGEYLWNIGEEPHYGDHYWKLSVYELDDASFKQAKWWNDGLEYITEKKISNQDSRVYESELIKLFQKKIKSR